eukprot:Lithocolla_globosa_v1_NODE_3213_length_1731_cov_8.599045.p2 type:complete len:184 gc:universal NODE_3213_length_1731_cov_8.599045:599-48(-)
MPQPKKTPQLHSLVRWNKDKNEIKEALNAESVKETDPGNGNHVLHIASQNGHTDLVQLIIDAGADVNAQNDGGQTALHMAVAYDFDEISEILRKAGADDSITNDAGFPAKAGLDGTKDPASPMNKFQAATTTEALLEAFALLKEAKVERSQVAMAGLKKKKAVKEAWVPEVDAKFKELVASLS